LRELEIRQAIAMFAKPEISVFVFQHQLAVFAVNLMIEVAYPDRLT
jgi:hypothetical protein